MGKIFCANFASAYIRGGTSATPRPERSECRFLIIRYINSHVTNLIIESIGLVAGTMGLIAWIPQLQTVWIQREHRGVNCATLMIIFIALCTWCVYGIMKHAWAVCVSNLCSGVLVATILARVTWLRGQQNSRPAAG